MFVRPLNSVHLGLCLIAGNNLVSGSGVMSSMLNPLSSKCVSLVTSIESLMDVKWKFMFRYYYRIRFTYSEPNWIGIIAITFILPHSDELRVCPLHKFCITFLYEYSFEFLSELHKTCSKSFIYFGDKLTLPHLLGGYMRNFRFRFRLHNNKLCYLCV